MIWLILFWIVGLAEFGRVTYLSLAALIALPRSVAMRRRHRLFAPLSGGAVSVLCLGLTVYFVGADSISSTIAILVGLLTLLVSYGAMRRLRLSIGVYTPYDLQESFDLFISYRRTLHAERVRHIAESLISQGIRVWFDDYAMFSTNLQSDEEMETSVRAGIENSSRGLIYLTNDYCKSKWCQDECKELKKRFDSSPDKLLKHEPKIEKNEYAEIETILRDLQLKPSPVRIPPLQNEIAEKSDFYRDESAGYKFNKAGWEMTSRGGRFFPVDIYKGPILTCYKGSNLLNLNIDIGPSATYPARLISTWRQGDKYAIMQRAINDLFSHPPDPDTSEKSLWRAGYNFAQRYAKEKGVAIRGSHVFVLGQEYHYAVTYWDKRGWVRRYSIVATDPVTLVKLELAVGFKFFAPFVEFCAWAYQMDALVSSFRPLSNEIL